MTHKDFASLIDRIGIPNCYRAFSENNKRKILPPYISFFFDSSGDMFADGENYQKIEHAVVELYSNDKEFEIEKKIEREFKTQGITWKREESYISQEQLYMTVYYVDILINEEK